MVGPSRASAGRASRAAAESAANCSWLSLEAIIAFFAAGQGASLLLEVGHADCGECGCGVMLSLILVDFVDRYCGVNNRGLDGFLLDDGLDGLKDVSIASCLANKC